MNSNEQQQFKIEWKDKNMVIADRQFTMKERQTMYLVFETIQQKILHEKLFDYSICPLVIQTSYIYCHEEGITGLRLKILTVFYSYKQDAIDKFEALEDGPYWWHIKVQYQRVKFIGHILSELRKIEQNG